MLLFHVFDRSHGQCQTDRIYSICCRFPADRRQAKLLRPPGRSKTVRRSNSVWECPSGTLRAPNDAERHALRYHAERGNDQRAVTHSPHPFAFDFAFRARQPRHHTSRLGCRLNAGDAEWAERHGCRESAVRTWMSVRRVPTERRRSEGTTTKESPNQEQAPLVTWGAFPSNPPKAERFCR